MYNPQEKNIDLIREYFPSFNSARFQDQPEPSLAIQENFKKVISEQTKEVTSRDDIKVDNLRYGGTDDRQLVDIYYKNGASESAPLFVYIHGGYWQMLDKSYAGSMVPPLVERGYRVVVADYNKCPQVTLPQLMEEFTNFLLWLFDYAEKQNSKEISFAGHSAGAHLLAQLLHIPSQISEEQRKKVHALFFVSGVYDLRELWQLPPVNPNNMFGLNTASAEQLSPMLWPWQADSPSWPGVKSYVLTGAHESVTFIEQNRIFAEKLKEAGFNSTFKLFDNYDHFDIIEEMFVDNSIITKYLLETLQAK